jgi:hypothetical protein
MVSRTIGVIALAGSLAGCLSSTTVAVPTEVVGIVALDVAPGAGRGVGPEGGCGSVAFGDDLRLHGDPTRTPSVWLEFRDSAEILAVRWPPGFSARFEPELVIYDAHRRPVARDGDALADAGGYPADNGRPIRLFSFNGVDYPCE